MKCRPDNMRRTGGIGIYVHEKLKPFIKEIEGNCEYVLWIEIKHISPTIVLLGVVYIPPKANLADFGRLFRVHDSEHKKQCYVAQKMRTG